MGRHFTDIFAGRFAEDAKTGQITSVKSSVTFTEKTKFLYAINKGISGPVLRRQPYRVNDAIAKEERRVAFEYMVYLGDGPSDIPCFSAVEPGRQLHQHSGRRHRQQGVRAGEGQADNRRPLHVQLPQRSDLRLMLDTIIHKVGYLIAARNKESKAL